MTDPNYVSPIEFDPSHLDRVAGMAGRLALRLAGTEQFSFDEEYAGPSVTDLVDAYEASGVDYHAVDPNSDEGKHFVVALQHGPQLEKPIFIPDFPKLIDDIDPVNLFKLTPSSDQPVQLPTRNFVWANDMVDWNSGRGRQKHGQTSGSSAGVIRSLARKGTPPPSINTVTANIQPNGRVLYASIQDGAHRVAAAHLRGDPTVAVGGAILVRKLSRNILENR